MLEEATEWVIKKGLTNVEQLQRHGSLLESLIDLENQLRVLVIGKLGEDQSSNKTIGSQLESIIRSIKSHTLVVTSPFSIPTSYLIAFDGSPTSEKLIEKAIKTPLLFGLDCHFVMVDDFAAKSAAFEKAAIKLKNAGLSVHEGILSGSVDEALLKYQKDHQIGMMVMGAYGHSTLRQFFLGSNTTKVLIKSEVPLLLIR